MIPGPNQTSKCGEGACLAHDEQLKKKKSKLGDIINILLRALLERSSGNSGPVNQSVSSSGAKWQLLYIAGFKLSS